MDDPARADALAGDPVRLTIPAQARFVRIARLVASAAGTDAGFDLDDLDDLRIGVDELCAQILTLLPADGDHHLDLEFLVQAGRVAVEVRGPAGLALADDTHPSLSNQILAVVADEVRREVRGGDVRYTLLKGTSRRG